MPIKATQKHFTCKKQQLSMQTIEITDALYEELQNRRIGRESISKTILREMKDDSIECNAELVDSDCEKALKSSKKLYSLEEAFHDL